MIAMLKKEAVRAALLVSSLLVMAQARAEEAASDSTAVTQNLLPSVRVGEASLQVHAFNVLFSDTTSAIFKPVWKFAEATGYYTQVSALLQGSDDDGNDSFWIRTLSAIFGKLAKSDAEYPNRVDINVGWKPQRSGFDGKMSQSIASNATEPFEAASRKVFEDTIANFREQELDSIKNTKAPAYITAALEALQKGAKRKERDVDRIRWALDSVAKYAGRTAYRQEVTSELRTGTSDKALQYMDCTEFAARFLQLVCGLEKVPWFTTADLASIAIAEGIYKDYLQFIPGSDDETFTDIKPGDIFLWRVDDNEKKVHKGHVGIVESYSEPYVYVWEALTKGFEDNLNSGACFNCVRKSKYTRIGKALMKHGNGDDWKGYFRIVINN